MKIKKSFNPKIKYLIVLAVGIVTSKNILYKYIIINRKNNRKRSR